MNGTTSFIARGAQIASEKGIIVVVAAGNEGNQTWKYIVTPADNEKVYTIGGVDSTGNPSIFTSFGPNSAGKVKPDASARATSTYFAYNNGAYPGNGTSYATHNRVMKHDENLEVHLKNIEYRTSYVVSFFMVLLLMIDSSLISSSDYIDYVKRVVWSE